MDRIRADRPTRMHGTKQLILGGVAAASLALLGVAGPAAAQTDTGSQPAPTATSTQTTPTTTSTPTSSTPTTSTPTTSTPTTSTPSVSGPTSAPNEYVESVPTASGLRAVSRNGGDSTSQSSSSSSESSKPTDTTAKPAAPKAKHHARRHAPAPAGPSTPASQPTTQVPVAPASATEGGNSSLIWMLAAMAAITAVVIATAGLQRKRARA